MIDIEIPYEADRGIRYRFLEMLPAILSWSVITAPIWLSFIDVIWAAYFIVAFITTWFLKTIVMAFRVIQGYGRMEKAIRLDWDKILGDLKDPAAALKHYTGHVTKQNRVHVQNLKNYVNKPPALQYVPSDVIHVVIVALHNEPIEIVEPTIQELANCKFPMKKQVVFAMAYEERGGPGAKITAEAMVKRYGKAFLHAEAIEHPSDIPGEVKGKGGNVTFAGRRMAEWVKAQGLDPSKVVVTTLDCDNRPHKYYFAAVTYAFLLSRDRSHRSFQPIPLYTNNIWDAPAPMRVLAVGNSFWQVIQSVRPHTLRNFSSHAQPLDGLIKTDFWSVRTVVEDGHQFWRSLFAFDGNHQVVPIYVPIYQDAVLAETLRKTFREQFIQIRRWAWGASDVAYLIEKGFFTRNKLSKSNLIAKLLRLIEGHVSWATAPFILAFAAWAPIVVSPEADSSVIAHQLPVFASRLATLGMIGILCSLYFSMKILPPRPTRYKRHRHLFMIAQWAILPLVTLVYGGLTALYSQTRLFFGWYLDRFDATVKVVKK